MPIQAAILENDPGKLLQFFEEEVYFGSGINFNTKYSTVFKKSDSRLSSEFRNRKGKFYNVIFNTQKARKDGTFYLQEQKSYKEALQTGWILDVPDCNKMFDSRRGNREEINIVASAHPNVIEFKCRNNDCHQCKIYGFFLANTN